MATFSGIFWFTLAIIFASAIIGAIVSRRQRDRCLALVDDYHVTLVMTSGDTIWGDLRVFPQGLEVVYDAAYATRLGVVKSGYLLYEGELGQVLALVRYIGDLTPDEVAQRAAQVHARFKPGPSRRALRSLRNMVNTVRDAFSQAVGVFVGQMATQKAAHAQALKSRKGDVEHIGKTLIGAAANAWEPMLERHIGLPVVLELASPDDPDRRVELPGYLAEYSDKFVALFNVEQPVGETIEIDLDEEVIEREDLLLSLEPHKVVITNLSDIPLVIGGIRGDEDHRKLDVVLTRGATARVPRLPGALTVMLHRVAHVDVVCPRAHATIRYASREALPTHSEHALAPVHEDQSVSFP